VTDKGLWSLVLTQAACRASELNPDDWYPVSAEAAAARREAARAIAVCAACAVRTQCLDLALRNWAIGQFGVWGGTVPAERSRPGTGRGRGRSRQPVRT
jgi:Transcription factor WhiB